MVSTTSKLTQVMAVAPIRMTSIELIARAIAVIIVLYYGILLDFLSGTKED
ncbi:MAG: hypothetical protein ACREPR_09670 [Brasilonema sp.]